MQCAWRRVGHAFCCFKNRFRAWLGSMKIQRHNAIKDLLVKTSVTNQDELRRKLAGKGIHATQATLSRDIRELKLVKGPDGYALPNTATAEDEDLPQLADVLLADGLLLAEHVRDQRDLGEVLHRLHVHVGVQQVNTVGHDAVVGHQDRDVVVD